MIRTRSLRFAFPLFLSTLAAALCAAPGFAAPAVSRCTIDGDRVLVTLDAPAYRVIEVAGEQQFQMDQFGNLGVPGAPQLPMARFLVALPPGATAESIEVLRSRSSMLPGTYRIRPAPPIYFLPDMPGWEKAMEKLRAEWDSEFDSVYGAGMPYPEENVWLAGKGAFRAYSYASVAFCPFTYDPSSGQVEQISQVEVAIRCRFPDGSSEQATPEDGLVTDPATDERARSLFSNYDQVAELYHQGTETSRSGDNYDYVIITTGSLVNAINTSGFAAWKASMGYSVRTVLTTDPEIAGQPGADLAERIRTFLRNTYAAWGIRYVLMVGDYATVPMRICYPDPDYHVYNPNNPGLVAPGTPTDYYYADLSAPDADSWDSDGDGYPGEYGQDDPDFLAEVAVGRIPVNDPGRITYTLEKIALFEQDTGAWKRNVLQAGAILFYENQDHGGTPFVDGASCLDSMETALMGGCTIQHYSEQAGLTRSLCDWPALTEATFTSAWHSGQNAVVNWSGHGWPDGAYRTIWTTDDGDGVPESGELQSQRFVGLASTFLDDDYPSVVFAISCDVGYPEPNPYGNLGIDLLTLPGWGTSTGIVSSARPAAVSGDWRHDPGGTEQICYDFNRYMIQENERVGDALYDGKFSATTQYGWNRVYEYMNLYNFNLFGDPALQVDRTTVDAPELAIDGGGTVILQPGAPNPFQSLTSLRLLVPQASHVRVSVHDIEGRSVATLADAGYAAGSYTISWDGTDDQGRRLPAGLYFVAARSGADRTTRRLLLVR